MQISVPVTQFGVLHSIMHNKHSLHHPYRLKTHTDNCTIVSTLNHIRHLDDDDYLLNIVSID
jgi:hypothetical protein